MADPHPLQVQGLCRFSFPCTGGFQKYHDDLSERRAALYDPKRLDQRLLWFEQIGLPGLAAQSDPDFTLHMLIGEDLPNPWRDRLKAAIKAVPQIKPHVLPPIDHRDACRQVLHDGRDLNRTHVAEFRLDDDDAVAVNYVASLRGAQRKMSRIAGPNGRVALDHGRGIVVQGMGDGAVTLHPLLTHCWSAGLALYMTIADEGIIMDFPHHKIWMRMPYVNLTDQIMFIRGDHGTNDARTPWSTAGRFPIDDAAWPEIFQTRFGVDIDIFKAEWPKVATP